MFFEIFRLGKKRMNSMLFEFFKLAKIKFMFLSSLTLQKITFMLFDIVHKILKETQTRRISSFSNSKSKHGYVFFAEERASKKRTDSLFGIYESPKDTNSIFLQAKNAQTCANSKC